MRCKGAGFHSVCALVVPKCGEGFSRVAKLKKGLGGKDLKFLGSFDGVVKGLM